MKLGKFDTHPLVVLFGCRIISTRRGMNILQEGPIRLISDQCVTPQDVAPCDVEAVLKRSGATWLLPL